MSLEKLKKSINELEQQLKFNNKNFINSIKMLLSIILILVVSFVWLRNCSSSKEVIFLENNNNLCKVLGTQYYTKIDENIICENEEKIIFINKNKPKQSIIFSLKTYKEYNLLQSISNL